MHRIGAIMELAKSMDPQAQDRTPKDEPRFVLWTQETGEWSARVSVGNYYAESTGRDTPELAMEDLYRRLLSVNETVLARVKERLARYGLSARLPVLRLAVPSKRERDLQRDTIPHRSRAHMPEEEAKPEEDPPNGKGTDGIR